MLKIPSSYMYYMSLEVVLHISWKYSHTSILSPINLHMFCLDIHFYFSWTCCKVDEHHGVHIQNIYISFIQVHIKLFPGRNPISFGSASDNPPTTLNSTKCVAWNTCLRFNRETAFRFRNSYQVSWEITAMQSATKCNREVYFWTVYRYHSRNHKSTSVATEIPLNGNRVLSR